MEVKVTLSNIRIAPRKVRMVADMIRGKKTSQAQSILAFTVNKSARPVLKLLNSAVATAKNEFKLNESNLFVSKVMVDEGPKLKRWHPMSRGRAYPIMKRTSHVVLALGELTPTAAKPGKKETVVAKKEEEKKETVKKPAKKTNTKKKA